MFDLRSIRVIVLGALAMLLAFTMPSFSSATFTSSSTSSVTVTSGTWAIPDTTAPTVTLTVPGQVSGTRTVTASATDDLGGTGVKSVTFQTRLPNGGWTDRHTSTSTNPSWSWNTTTLRSGYYDVRAKATDGAGNEGFSSPTRTLVLNGLALVMTPPPEVVDGRVTLQADVLERDSAWFWTLAFEYRPRGGRDTDWQTVGPTSPWAHSITRTWDTRGLENGVYELRAVRVASWPYPDLTSTTVQVTVQNPRSALTTDRLPRTQTVRNDAVAITADEQVESVAASPSEDNASVEEHPLDPAAEEIEEQTAVEPAPHEPPSTHGSDEDEAASDNDEEETPAGDDGVVEEAELRGVGIDVTDGGDGVGRVTEGDSFTFTYSGEIALTTVRPGWSGEPTAVSVRLRDGHLLGGDSQHDTLDILSGDLPVGLGQVKLGVDVIDTDQEILVPGTMTAQTVTVDGAELSTVTVTLGVVVDEADVLLPASTPVLTWTPSVEVTTLTGRPCVADPVTRSAGGSF